MHYPSLKRVIIENSKDNLTQGNDKNFYVKDGLDKSFFSQNKVKTLLKNFNSLQYLAQEIQTLHYPSVFYPSLLSLQTELLAIPQILHFKLLVHIIYCPLSTKYPYSFICL